MIRSDRSLFPDRSGGVEFPQGGDGCPQMSSVFKPDIDLVLVLVTVYHCHSVVAAGVGSRVQCHPCLDSAGVNPRREGSTCPKNQ